MMKLPAPLSIAVACVALVGHVAPASAQPEQRLFVDEYLLQSAALVDADGEAISGAAFTPLDWYPVSVPSTVLRALVANGVYPDPYVGMNNMQIPDANDAFNREYDLARFSHLPDQANPWSSPWWYRAEFEAPDLQPGTEVWLNFEGINYRADVWLNGMRCVPGGATCSPFRSIPWTSLASRPSRNWRSSARSDRTEDPPATSARTSRCSRRSGGTGSPPCGTATWASGRTSS
jgi:hypothetical protein